MELVCIECLSGGFGLFVKGAGHKYIKRELVSTSPRKYRYWYKLPRGALVHDDAVHVGAKFRHGSGDDRGHYHVDEVHDDGSVSVTHDETGHTTKVSAHKLKDMIHTGDHDLGESPQEKGERVLQSYQQALQTGTDKQISLRLHDLMEHVAAYPQESVSLGYALAQADPGVKEAMLSLAHGGVSTFKTHKSTKKRGKKGEKTKHGGAHVEVTLEHRSYGKIVEDSAKQLEQLDESAIVQEIQEKTGATEDEAKQAFLAVKNSLAKKQNSSNEGASYLEPFTIDGESVPGVFVYSGSNESKKGTLYVRGLIENEDVLDPGFGPAPKSAKPGKVLARAQAVMRSKLDIGRVRQYTLTPSALYEWSHAPATGADFKEVDGGAADQDSLASQADSGSKSSVTKQSHKESSDLANSQVAEESPDELDESLPSGSEGLQYEGAKKGGQYPGAIVSHPDFPDKQFMVKPGRDFLVHAEVAGTNLAARVLGDDVAKARHIDVGGAPQSIGKGQQHASIQEMRENDGDLVSNRYDSHMIRNLPQELKQDVLRHQVATWLVGDSDAHAGQFLRGTDGSLIRIDLGQAYKHIGNDRLDPSWQPNNPPPVVSHLLVGDYAKGQGELDFTDPRIKEAVERAESITDDEVAQAVQPYADGLEKSGIRSAKETIAKAVARKNGIRSDFEQYFSKALSQRHGKPMTFSFEDGISEGGVSKGFGVWSKSGTPVEDADDSTEAPTRFHGAKLFYIEPLMEEPKGFGALTKGSKHKYVKREVRIGPDGKKRYRYWYKLPKGHIVTDDSLHIGAKFRHGKDEERGHFHIESINPDGTMNVRHDETGEFKKVTLDNLRGMIHTGSHDIGENPASKLQRLLESLHLALQHGTKKQYNKLYEHVMEHVEAFPHIAFEGNEPVTSDHVQDKMADVYSAGKLSEHLDDHEHLSDEVKYQGFFAEAKALAEKYHDALVEKAREAGAKGSSYTYWIINEAIFKKLNKEQSALFEKYKDAPKSVKTSVVASHLGSSVKGVSPLISELQAAHAEGSQSFNASVDEVHKKVVHIRGMVESGQLYADIWKELEDLREHVLSLSGEVQHELEDSYDFLWTTEGLKGKLKQWKGQTSYGTHEYVDLVHMGFNGVLKDMSKAKALQYIKDNVTCEYHSEEEALKIVGDSYDATAATFLNVQAKLDYLKDLIESESDNADIWAAAEVLFMELSSTGLFKHPAFEEMKTWKKISKFVKEGIEEAAKSPTDSPQIPGYKYDALYPMGLGVNTTVFGTVKKENPYVKLVSGSDTTSHEVWAEGIDTKGNPAYIHVGTMVPDETYPDLMHCFTPAGNEIKSKGKIPKGLKWGGNLLVWFKVNVTEPKEEFTDGAEEEYQAFWGATPLGIMTGKGTPSDAPEPGSESESGESSVTEPSDAAPDSSDSDAEPKPGSPDTASETSAPAPTPKKKSILQGKKAVKHGTLVTGGQVAKKKNKETGGWHIVAEAQHGNKTVAKVIGSIHKKGSKWYADNSPEIGGFKTAGALIEVMQNKALDVQNNPPAPPVSEQTPQDKVSQLISELKTVLDAGDMSDDVISTFFYKIEQLAANNYGLMHDGQPVTNKPFLYQLVMDAGTAGNLDNAEGWKVWSEHKNKDINAAVSKPKAPADVWMAIQKETNAAAYKKQQAEVADKYKAHGHLIESPPAMGGFGALQQDNTYADGSVGAIRAIHDHVREKYNLGSISAKHHNKRKDVIAALFPAENSTVSSCAATWTTTSNPIGYGGSLNNNVMFRFFSIAMGLRNLEEEISKLKDIYGMKPQHEQRFRQEYAEFVDPSHSRFRQFECLLLRHVVWRDAVMANGGEGVDTATGTLHLFRGMGKLSKDYVDGLREGNLGQTSAASWSTVKSVANSFSGGGFGSSSYSVVFEADSVPIEHCLLGKHTEGIGFGSEKEVIVGTAHKSKTVHVYVKPPGMDKETVMQERNLPGGTVVTHKSLARGGFILGVVKNSGFRTISKSRYGSAYD